MCGGQTRKRWRLARQAAIREEMRDEKMMMKEEIRSITMLDVGVSLLT